MSAPTADAELAALQAHVLETMRGYLGTTVAQEVDGGLMTQNPVPKEIALRVRLNAELVGPDALRDQVLIVLNDYRDHAWTWGRLSSQSQRNALATRLLSIPTPHEAP
jgi:hypothetical protein